MTTPARLVQQHVGERCFATGSPSTSTTSRGLDERVQLPGLAVHAHPAGLDQLVGLAARGDAGACEIRVRAASRCSLPRAVRDRSTGLERLADLLVGFGANLQQGQILGVTAYHGMEERRTPSRAPAYKRGAKYVDVFWWDPLVKRERLEHAAEDTLDFVPPWIDQRLEWLSEEHAARVSLAGTSSAAFEGIDPARMGRDLLPYVSAVPRIVNERTTNWCAGPCPNPAGRSACIPSSSPTRRSRSSGRRSSYVLRLDTDDPVEPPGASG